MIKVTYEGFEEFSKGLGTIKFSKAINKGFRIAGPIIQWSVRKETPVRTGTLQRGWKTIPGNMYYEIKNKTKYGPFVNFWTKFITANPFMEKWFNQVKNTVKVIVFTQLRKELYK